jgi:methyltransferase (TIGR00027 family)
MATSFRATDSCADPPRCCHAAGPASPAVHPRAEIHGLDRLFADPFAETLAGDQGVAMLARSERAGGGESRFIPVRVRWFDDATTDAVAAGVRQVALLGAGLDTRPYRLDLPSDVDWYELDRPEIFAAKNPVLAAATARCRRHTVVVDLVHDWDAALLAAGFAPTRCTLWLAEGLFFYLTYDSIIALLRRAAALSPPGSLFLADVMGTTGMDGAAMQAFRDYRERNHLPPPFGSDDPAAVFATGGWHPDLVTTPGGPEANYGRLPPVPTGLRPGWPHLVTGRLSQTHQLSPA